MRESLDTATQPFRTVLRVPATEMLLSWASIATEDKLSNSEMQRLVR